MLSIANLMVDARCVATTGGSRLFCYILISIYIYVIHVLVVGGSSF
jgi:hypothetical protein